MNTIGIFAGRGDIIIAFFLALLVGFYIGYKIKTFSIWLKTKLNK